jgi:exopolyphosphatase/guanosine-5'-triphosphate,3'-diphosphate pyrophosphatase
VVAGFRCTTHHDGVVQRLAVADLGSNSFRLVVYGYEPGRWWAHVDEIREAVRISEGMGDDGALRAEPMRRALRTVAVFDAFCRATGVEAVEAVATSAIRDATNQRELLDAIAERTSLPVRVLSTADEARYGYLAIVNSTTLADGFGLDIGGGSVQAMRIEERQLASYASWPMGAVRMSERFLHDDDSGGKQLKALRKHVAKQLADADWLGGAGRLVGIGGTIRNLAAAAERHAGVDHPDAQGYVLTRDALGELVDRLASVPAVKRGAMPGIKPDRGDVILGGAAVLAAVMDEGGFEELEVTEAGLREGVFYERILDGDPPLLPDVRRASVENLASRYQDDLHHPRHVASLSEQLLDGLATHGLYEPDDADRELLWAACMLHDVGVAVDYDDHHKHSRYLILNAGLPGFTPREVELIALIARYHRKGTPDVSEMGKLARKGDERRLSVLAGTVRLAEQLERARDGAVRRVDLRADNGRVVVTPEASSRAAVAIWSARRNADLLAEAIDREVDIADA